MAPSLALRKPSPAPLAAVEAFIRDGEGDAAEPHAAPVAPQERPALVMPSSSSGEADAITFRRPSRSMIKRRTKPDRRRVTVYLDIDVAGDLAEYVATADREMSIVVNDALRAWLRK